MKRVTTKCSCCGHVWRARVQRWSYLRECPLCRALWYESECGRALLCGGRGELLGRQQ